MVIAAATATTPTTVAARTMPTELLVEMVDTMVVIEVPTVAPAATQEVMATIKEMTATESYPFELPY